LVGTRFPTTARRVWRGSDYLTEMRPRPSAGPIDDSGLSEIDQRILELNHDGHSMRQISRLLKERYNIQLGRPSVIRHLMELRQDPDSDVQINNECTIPLKPRYESRWYKVIERLKVAISDYTRLHKAKPSFRTMQIARAIISPSAMQLSKQG
jgi:hypothetical protein